MANTITKENNRRAALRRRLNARYPLFADEFYQQDILRHRAYFRGQPVPAPSHPRRRRPARRPIDTKALAAFRARQLDLLAWKRPSRTRGMVRQVVAAIAALLQKVVPVILKPCVSRGQRWREFLNLRKSRIGMIA